MSNAPANPIDDAGIAELAARDLVRCTRHQMLADARMNELLLTDIDNPADHQAVGGLWRLDRPYTGAERSLIIALHRKHCKETRS